MNLMSNRIKPVVQNVILGSVTGVMVGINLRTLFLRVGGTDIVWPLFFILGPAIGYFSGKERERFEKLKKEKQNLEENLNKIHTDLKSSKQKYRLLVENAGDAIYLTTVRGKFLLFNEATCLLSGYRKHELKTMSMSDLKVNKKGDIDDKSWLDNSFCRYEEKWRNRNGDVITLEVNSKLINFGKHKLLLHVGRDVVSRKELNKEATVLEIRRLQENRLIEMATVHRVISNEVLNPVSDAIKMLHRLLKDYPEEVQKLTDILSGWGRAKRVIKGLSDKISRDLTKAPAHWKINEVIQQEIDYFNHTTNSKDFTLKTSFSSESATVFGFGRDYSLAFGSVIKAAVGSWSLTEKHEIDVVTRKMNDNVFVEFPVKSEGALKSELCRVFDPFFKDEHLEDMEKLEVGFWVCQGIFESFDAEIDVGKPEKKKTLVRIRVPMLMEVEEAKRVVLAESLVI